MGKLGRILWVPALAAGLALGGCAAGTNPLGGVLGGILNPAPNDQVTGSVSSVDTRNQQIFMNTDNGQQVTLSYDNRTQVVFNGQQYPVTSLERGDQITARIQGTTNGGYYTDAVQVTQPVQNSGTYNPNGGYQNQQAVEGSVSQINYQNGTFVLTQGNNSSILVSMPYNPRQMDVQRFNQLRNGDYIRLQGQWLASNRFQLSAFM